MISDKIFLRVFGTVFSIVGIVLAGIAVNAYLGWSSAQAWEPGEAEITSVTKKRTKRRTSLGRNSSHRSNHPSTKVQVKYQYEFKGKTYDGDGVDPLFGYEFFESTRLKTYSKYRKIKAANKKITCYVNPKDPRQAYLEKTYRSSPLWMLGGGAAIFFTVGMVCWMASFLSWIKNRKAQMDRMTNR